MGDALEKRERKAVHNYRKEYKYQNRGEKKKKKKKKKKKEKGRVGMN